MLGKPKNSGKRLRAVRRLSDAVERPRGATRRSPVALPRRKAIAKNALAVFPGRGFRNQVLDPVSSAIELVEGDQANSGRVVLEPPDDHVVVDPVDFRYQVQTERQPILRDRPCRLIPQDDLRVLDVGGAADIPRA